MFTEFHNFKHVNVLDKNDKNVLAVTCEINLRLDFYTDDEVKNLTPSYRSIVDNNCICEFELIFTNNINLNKLQPNENYSISIFDRKCGYTTNFQGIIFKLERTHKVDSVNNKYFYTGAKIAPCLYDGIFVFNSFSPKTFMAVNKNNVSDCFVCKVFSKKSEDEFLHNNKYFDYNFYNISKFDSVAEKSLNDGVPHAIQPIF